MATTPATAMTHTRWILAAQLEYERLVTLLADLDEADWERPTSCTEWDVRQMVAHLVGAADGTASMREMLRQARRGRRLRPGAPLVDGINAVQVTDREQLGPRALVAALERSGARGVRRGRRLPGAVRALPMPFGPPLGVRPLGYLMDRIYTRDAWMHRMDICEATGREPLLTGDHDGCIVADVVDEWLGSHDQPVELVLTGPAGGTWRRGGAGERLELDAIELARVLSGRLPAVGLLAHPVPF